VYHELEFGIFDGDSAELVQSFGDIVFEKRAMMVRE
jgi:hypothetical protein